MLLYILAEGTEDKLALMKTCVGDDEVVFGDLDVIVKQDVHVNQTRAVWNRRDPTHLLLQRL